MRFLRDGHLDHSYASTVHRAQGATVDRAFVLGSDELYREWGYTALSRHRDAARFYVTAASPFINQAPAPLEPGENVAFRVARMLGPAARNCSPPTMRRSCRSGSLPSAGAPPPTCGSPSSSS